MPGHTNGPYWSAVDFDSEGDEDRTPPPNNRVYLDPWDNDAFGMIQGESTDFNYEQMNSFAGEPVSASFYYVPTKTYDSNEEPKATKRAIFPEDVVTPDYSVYARKSSRHVIPDYHDMPIYGARPMQERRRSMYVEEPIYVPVPHPMVYESLYAPVGMPNPHLHPPTRSHMSLQHQADYVMANGSGKRRRSSRLNANSHTKQNRVVFRGKRKGGWETLAVLAEAYEQCAYETHLPEYEDWARPVRKTAPDNFHLSKYGHLQIDYSCSWNSLDRIIRNQ